MVSCLRKRVFFLALFPLEVPTECPLQLLVIDHVLRSGNHTKNKKNIKTTGFPTCSRNLPRHWGGFVLAYACFFGCQRLSKSPQSTLERYTVLSSETESLEFLTSKKHPKNECSVTKNPGGKKSGLEMLYPLSENVSQKLFWTV